MANGGASIYSGANQNLNGTNISWSGGTASYKISNFATLYNQQSGQHQWLTAPSGTAGNAISFTQAMTLTAAGRLLIGTTSEETYKLDVNDTGNIYARLKTTGSANWSTLLLENGDGTWHITNDDTGTFNIGTGADPSSSHKFTIENTGAATFSSSVDVNGSYFQMGGSGLSAPPAALNYGLFPQSSIGLGLSSLYGMTFWTGTTPTERIRITSDGFTKASNTNSYISSTGTYHEMRSSIASDTLVLSNTNASGSGYYSELATSGTSQYHFSGYASGAYRIFIYSNGNIVNTNGSYGAISDAKLKENITDATPKLEKLLKVKIRNYNLIGEETKQIGVIAQELEEIFPSMISETPDFETDKETGERIDLGTNDFAGINLVQFMLQFAEMSEGINSYAI
jgi:hypothetical protein